MNPLCLHHFTIPHSDLKANCDPIFDIHARKWGLQRRFQQHRSDIFIFDVVVELEEDWNSEECNHVRPCILETTQNSLCCWMIYILLPASVSSYQGSPPSRRHMEPCNSDSYTSFSTSRPQWPRLRLHNMISATTFPPQLLKEHHQSRRLTASNSKLLPM